MLERMYLRWAEKSGMKVDTLERSTNDDAGIKNGRLGDFWIFCLWKIAVGKWRASFGAIESV